MYIMHIDLLTTMRSETVQWPINNTGMIFSLWSSKQQVHYNMGTILSLQCVENSTTRKGLRVQTDVRRV
jgi:dolichyl-phosphate-mannose--protein O-mannosyl transferase